MWVQLTRRLAECVDGIDLSRRCVGDVISLSKHDAELLIAEGWATPAHPDDSRARHGVRAEAANGSGRRPYKHRT